MGYILIILLLLNMSGALAFLFKKRLEETLFISISSIILILFAFGLFKALNIGYYFILGINILLLAYNLWQIIKDKKNAKNLILTPVVLLLLISCLFFCLVDYGRQFVVWDEFSHWALVVKNMFHLNNFGLGNDSTVLVKTYLSGPGLFQYFCAKLNGSYNESIVYFAFNLLLVSFILPVFKKFKTLKSINLYISYALFIILPLVFYPNVYNSIYVDPMLGIAFAYTIFSYYFNYEDENKTFKLMNLALSLAILIFIKDFGLVLGGIAFVIILIDNLFIKNKFQFKIKTIFKNSIWIILTFIPALIIKFVWGLNLKANNVSAAMETKAMITNSINFFLQRLEGYKAIVAHDYIKALFYNPLTDSATITLTFVLTIGAFILVTYLISHDVKDEREKRSYKLIGWLVTLGSMAYAFLILATAYLSVFSEYEALRLASFQRYLSTYSLGMLILALALLVYRYRDDIKGMTKGLVLFFITSLLFINFSAIINVTFLARANVGTTIETRSAYSIFKSTTDKYVANNERVYFVSTNDNGIDFYIARYELTPKKMNLAYAWSIGQPYNEGDIWTVYKDPKDWSNELVTSYDYVYLFDIDEEFINNYGILFDEKSSIVDNSLFKVNKDQTGKILELVTE